MQPNENWQYDSHIVAKETPIKIMRDQNDDYSEIVKNYPNFSR